MVLHLDTKRHKPNIEYLLNTMNQIGQVKGVPISVEKLTKLVEDNRGKAARITEEINDILSTRINMSNFSMGIDFSSRVRTKNHIIRMLCKYYDEPTRFFEVMVKDSEQYKTSADHVEIFRGRMVDKGEDPKLLDLWKDLKYANYIVSTSNQLYSSLSQFLKDGGKITNGIFYAKSTFDLADTNRITTSKPNIQGMPEEFKELITAPPGYKIAKLDISGQEVHILLFGILRNKTLHENWRELRDPYLAILKTVGMPLTSEYREMTKVPVLGLMNGMGRPTLLKDVKNVEVVDTMIRIVEKDEGFKDVIQTYVDAQMEERNKFRKGLFGTQKPTNRFKGSERNQLRNGFFQLTAAEVVALSLQSLFLDLYEWDKTLDKLRLLLPIYDEFIFMVKDGEEEKATDIIERNVKPIVDDWPRFRGEIFWGQSYTAG